MPRIKGIERAFKAVVVGAREQVRDRLVRLAAEEHARIEAVHNPSHVRIFVDGIEGKPLHEIEPGGHAYIAYYYWSEVAQFARDLLLAASPVEDGEYRRAHILTIDGIVVEDPRRLEHVTEIILTNTVVYARRIEVPSRWWNNKTGQKGEVRGWSIQPQVPQPPKSVYKFVAAAVRARYGDIYQVRYETVEGPNGPAPAIVITDTRVF